MQEEFNKCASSAMSRDMESRSSQSTSKSDCWQRLCTKFSQRKYKDSADEVNSLMSYLFIAGMFFLVVAGLALKIFYGEETHVDKLGKSIAAELGTGFVIAGILGVTSEWFNRRRERHERMLAEKEHRKLRDAISANVLAAVYKRQVPDRVFDEMQDQLLQAEFYRTNVDVRFVIQKLESFSSKIIDLNTYVLVTEYVSFDLVNISGSAKTVPAETDSPTIENFEPLSRVISANIGGVELSEIECAACTLIEPGVVRFKHSAQHELASGDRLTCRIVLQYVRYARDEMSRITMRPEEGLTLSLVDPSDSFDIEAQALHAKEFRRDSAPGERVLQVFKLEHGVFPGNGAWWSWRPRGSSSNISEDALDSIRQKVQNDFKSDKGTLTGTKVA